MENIITKLESLTKDLKTIPIHKEECYICMEEIDLNKNSISLSCSHKLHFSCFMMNMGLGGNQSKKCGLCRENLVSQDLENEILDLRRQGLIEEQNRQNEYLQQLRQEEQQNNQEEQNNIIDPIRQRQMEQYLEQLRRREEQEQKTQEIQLLPRLRRGRRYNPTVFETLFNGLSISYFREISNIVENTGLSEYLVRRYIKLLVDYDIVHTGRGYGRYRNYRLNTHYRELYNNIWE